MSYAQFNPCNPCCTPTTNAGNMDLYSCTNILKRQSSQLGFSRVCSTNTKANAQNGREIESSWIARRTNLPTAQRSAGQIIASWDGVNVWMKETCQPTFIDEAVPGSMASIAARSATIYPIADTGAGWTVYKSDAVEEVAAFNVYSSNVVTSEIRCSYTFPDQTIFAIGCVFRLVDADNYYYLSWKRFTQGVTLTRVAGGVKTVVVSATTPTGLTNAYGYSVVFSITNNQLSARLWDSSFTLSTTINYTFPTNANATRFGIYRETISNQCSFPAMRVASNKITNFISGYQAGETPAIGGEHVLPSPDGLYDNVSLVVGSGKAFQPRVYVLPFGGISQFPYHLGFGAGVGPTQTLPGGSTVGGYFFGGREISPTATFTLHENGQFRTETWMPANVGSWFQLAIGSGGAYTVIEATNTLRTLTRSALGKETIGALPKYGYPNCSGMVIENTEARYRGRRAYVQPDGQGFGLIVERTTPYFGGGEPIVDYWVVRAYMKLIAGPLTWNDPFAPTTGAQEVIQTWYVENIVRNVVGNDGDPPTITPNDNDIRAQCMGQTYDGINGRSNVPVIWDCTPDLSSYICWYSLGDIEIKADAFTDVNWGSTTYNRFQTLGYKNWKVKAGGTVYEFPYDNTQVPSSWVVGPELVAFTYTFPDLGVRALRFYGSGGVRYEIPIGQRGVTNAGAWAMSDRFVYCSIDFDTEQNAKNFSTATIPTGMTLKWPATSLQWAISYDGSIRYTLTAVSGINTDGVTGTYFTPEYRPRAMLEQDGTAKYGGPFTENLSRGGAGDTIKNSLLPFSPPLSNPTF